MYVEYYTTAPAALTLGGEDRGRMVHGPTSCSCWSVELDNRTRVIFNEYFQCHSVCSPLLILLLHFLKHKSHDEYFIKICKQV